jgi:hypothetical protein
MNFKLTLIQLLFMITEGLVQQCIYKTLASLWALQIQTVSGLCELTCYKQHIT